MILVRSRCALVILCGLIGGCHDGEGPDAAGSAPGASASIAPATSAGPVQTPVPARPPASSDSSLPPESADIDKPAEHASDRLVGGTARRATVRAVVDDAILRRNPELVAKHFGGAPPFPLSIQRVAVHGGREAILVTSDQADVVPLIILADEAGNALWAKRRPLAGTREKVRGLSLLAGPDGSIALAWWDEPTRAVALRRWDYDGSVFADYHLFDADACDALDAIYWADHGWIVTVTVVDQGAARSQLVTEAGLGGFGGSVLEITSSERVTSRASAAAGIDGIFHAYLGRPTGPSPTTENPSLWVMLRREDGTPAWKAPLQVAKMRAGVDPHSAPVLTLETSAILRIEVGGETWKVDSGGRVIAKPTVRK